MHELLRTVLAGAVGAVVALSAVGGPPALAAAVADVIPDGSVTTAKLADRAVIGRKIASNAVSTPQLADGAVGNAELADGAVTRRKVAADSLTSIELSDGTVAGEDLGAPNWRIGPLDFPTIGGNSCAVSAPISIGSVITGDYLLVSQPAGVAGNITVSAREDPLDSRVVEIVLCNNGPSPFDPPARVYSLLVLRYEF